MNAYLFQLINQFALRWPLLDAIGIFLAAYLGYILILGLIFFLAIDFYNYRKIAPAALAAGFLARLIVAGFRLFFSVERPFVAGPVNLLIQRSASASFPSGHASFFFGLAFFLLFWFKKTTNPPKQAKSILLFCFISAFLIAGARVYAGIHWPLDVAAAIPVGLFAAWLTSKAVFSFLKNP